ncbi:MAG: 4Fe-4S binding protein [Sedimentisphaerales bacterium]|jgi:spermidine synthase
MTSCDHASVVPSRLTAVARGFVIFAYGLFSIAAQTLIFREFLTSFESNDITIGIFFGCWFVWIALGAVLVNKSKRLAELLLANIELLLLAYLPAFILEVILIIHIRQFAGIAPYVLLPIPTALLLGVLVNVPVSLITGLLFPLTCRWVQLDTTPSVSRVYLLESLGSFIGGLGTTLLLAFGVTSAKIFLLLAFILSVAVLLSLVAGSHRKTTIPVILLVILFGIGLASGIDRPIANRLNIAKWSRLLPADSLSGSFQTAQAEYLYGTYQGQWVVVREGSAVEAVPDPTSAGRTIALTLSQNPKGSRVLVIGYGLGLCRQFLQLPQIDRLVWAHPDNEYVSRVLQFAPRELSISDTRFERFAGDIRSLLNQQKEKFDLVIINMPDAASSASNRYFTLDFFEQVKRSLRPAGVLALCVPGGENIMGTELVTIGASAKLTLTRVFPNMVIAAGDQTWFIASDANDISGDPGTLRNRFAAIQNAAEVYPPNGLFSIYLPDRAAKAINAYNSADLPAEQLLNRDSRPLANLYSLLLSAKQSDAPVTRLFKYLVMAGLPVFLVPIFIYVLLRLIFLLTAPAGARPSIFDYTFLLFSVGTVGIGVVIVLMFLYQTRFGSLYLHIGAVSSLYMAGLAVGAAVANRFLRNHANRPDMLLTATLLIHCIILAAIAFWPAEMWGHYAFAVAFIVCGLCAGCYFPIAGRMLADCGLATTSVAAQLQTIDHFGAAAGGVVTTLALVPVLGARVTLLVFILLLLANLPAAALRLCCPAKATASSALRAAGFTLFGIAASIILCSNLLALAGRRFTPALPLNTAQALAGSLRIEATTAPLGPAGKITNYFKAYDANNSIAGYVFSSEDLAPDIRGFGGKINLAIFTDASGHLIDFNIVRSNETPAYFDMLANWLTSLKGRAIFNSQPFTGIDAVTGATVSSKAILKSLAESGGNFATTVLGQTGPQKAAGTTQWLPDSQSTYLLIAFLLTILVIYRGGYWSRFLIITCDVFIAGITLNAQFSTEQVASLLSFVLPLAAPSGVFILTIGAPLVAILFGNLYCGYLCPFGAFQELVGYLLPARFKPSISIDQMRKARFVKFLVLFVLIVAFFLSRNHDTLAVDPLIKAFSFSHSGKLPTLIVAIALLGSLFYSRFWCRYMCPAGAFLSLFNKIAIFSRYLPAKHYANCEYGLSYNDTLDCIYCDKCRYEPRRAGVAEPAVGFGSRYFLAAVLVVAVGISAISIRSIVRELPAPVVAATASSAGQPRNVDPQKIRKMIRENKLSDHEADFYKKTD